MRLKRDKREKVMKRYSTLHPLLLSFFSKSLYRDVCVNWKGVSFIYLLLLLALSWIPIMVKMHTRVSDFLNQEAPKIVKQVPVITIFKGEVSIDEQMPYFINDPDDDKPFIIIDTTGRIVSLESTDARILLTKSNLIMRKNATETRIFDLSQIDDLVIDRTRIYNWLETLKKWVAIFLYPFVLILSFAYRTMQVLLYAAIGILLAKNLEADLRYRSLVSLSIIAITPVVVLNTVYNYVDVKIPLWWFICFLIAMGYLYFGIKANAEKEITTSNP